MHHIHTEVTCCVGNEALKKRHCQNCFAEFCSDDFSLKNAQQSDHPVEIDETHIKAIIDSYQCTTCEIAKELNESHIRNKNFF